MTPRDAPDDLLVRLSVAGDASAFGLLARRHGPSLARTVRALGVAPSDVEDVVQTALLAAWRALADYDPARPFLGWACTIAANKARDWTRRRRVRRLWFDSAPLDSPGALAVADPGADPAVLEQREALRRIDAALRTLPDGLRVPFVLVTVAGLTYTEAAGALGITPKAVENRIAKVRRALAG